jgi:hypothetical protein
MMLRATRVAPITDRSWSVSDARRVLFNFFQAADWAAVQIIEAPLQRGATPMKVRIGKRDEYTLPCKIADLSTTDGLTPWMKRWLDDDADEIHRALTAEWSDIRHPSVGRFRDVVLTFHPFALASHEERWYLALKHPSNKGLVAEGTIYTSRGHE